MNHILIIEKDSFYSESLSGLLKAHNYAVDCVLCGLDALAVLKNNHYELVIADFHMEDVAITQFLSQLSLSNSCTNVLISTAIDHLESALAVLKYGASGYILKTIHSDEIIHTVARVFEQRRMRNEIKQLKNMLSLCQSSQAIAGCLEIERIYHLILDAVAREVGVDRYMGVFRSDKALEILQSRNVTAETASCLKTIIETEVGRGIAETELVKHIKDLPKTIPDMVDTDMEEAFLIFMHNHQDLLQGVMVLFNNPGLELPDFFDSKENILFLMEQSLKAFENAKSFSLANDMLFIDDLSGLYNHRYLEIALDRELKRIERYSSQLAVLFLDLDAFKQVNDSHGHLVGSQVLREVGILLRISVRDVDVVIRYGGDEYTIILVETSPEAAASVAERVRKQVESHSFLAERGLNIKITCSIGYSCCPDDTLSKHELLEMADIAMYAGKGSGKNCVTRHKKTS